MYNLRRRIQKVIDSKYNTEDKVKKYGEIFTPWGMIEEMVSLYSNDVWQNPNYIWLDPCAGLGNFFVIIVEKHMEGLKKIIPNEEERYKHIVEKQLYFIEINPRSCVWIRRIFNPGRKYKLNLVCADALDPDHPGWDNIGYMWDEEDMWRRKQQKLINDRSASKILVYKKFLIEDYNVSNLYEFSKKNYNISGSFSYK